MVVDPFKQAMDAAAIPDPFALAEAVSMGASICETGSWFGAPAVSTTWNGSKFLGGFGPIHLNTIDYWSLREASSQLFTENLYCRGLIRRLITNEINTGLTPDVEPNDELLPNMTDEATEDWSENTENRFEVWAKNPKLCDYEERRTFADLQKEIRRESLIEGDVLVVLRQDRRTQLPKIQIIKGSRIRSPFPMTDEQSLRVSHGVEVDDRGVQIAYWVTDREGNSKRMAAVGRNSGRRMAWLVYGTDRRTDQVRGTPILSLVMQSMRELDRYRDAELRAAVTNATLAMFVQKNQDRMGTRPLAGGAVRTTRVETTGLSNETREFNITATNPGMVIDELQYGEEPKSFNTSRPNVNYGAFEAAVVHAMAWSMELPPEILTLEFQSNYSASKAAIGEFKAYLSMFRADFGDVMCQPVYTSWLLSETLSGRIEAPGLLDSWRDPLQYDVFGAWTRAAWGGPVKPSIELSKDVKAYSEAIEAKLTTRDRASRDLFGVRFSKVVKRLKKEQRMLESAGLMPPEEDVVTAEAAAVGRPIQAMIERHLELVVSDALEDAAEG